MRAAFGYLAVAALLCTCNRVAAESAGKPVVVDSESPSDDLPPRNFRVAFVGDTGLRYSAIVLKKLKERNLDLFVHAGDLAYNKDPYARFRAMDEYMGPGFPFMATLGNHDMIDGEAWQGDFNATFVHKMQTLVREQSQKSGVSCRGIPGEMEVCHHRGITVVNLGFGVDLEKPQFRNYTSEDFVEFVRAGFASHPNSVMRVCHWHVPAQNYVLDDWHANKQGGWSVMEACRQAGAVVANGHHHVYTRTGLMTNYTAGSWVPETDSKRPALYHLSPGHSIQWISGLGGGDPQEFQHQFNKPYYEAMVGHSATLNKFPHQQEHLPRSKFGNFGALVCTLNPGGSDPYRADCDFTDIEGALQDEFSILSTPFSSNSSAGALDLIDHYEAEYENRVKNGPTALFAVSAGKNISTASQGSTNDSVSVNNIKSEDKGTSNTSDERSSSAASVVSFLNSAALLLSAAGSIANF